MDLLENSTYTTCTQCDQRIINYSNQICRRQFLPPSQINKYNKTRSIQINQLIDNKTSGNIKLDEFIKETQLNSKYCDNFIEWILHSNLININYLTNGGNSKVYSGTWNLLLNISLASKQLTNIALKVIRDSDNINDYVLNEVKKNQCFFFFFS